MELWPGRSRRPVAALVVRRRRRIDAPPCGAARSNRRRDPESAPVGDEAFPPDGRPPRLRVRREPPGTFPHERRSPDSVNCRGDQTGGARPHCRRAVVGRTDAHRPYPRVGPRDAPRLVAPNAGIHGARRLLVQSSDVGRRPTSLGRAGKGVRRRGHRSRYQTERLRHPPGERGAGFTVAIRRGRRTSHGPHFTIGGKVEVYD